MLQNKEQLIAQMRRFCDYDFRRFNYTDKLSVDNLLEMVFAVGRFREPRFRIDDHNASVYSNLAKWVVGDPSFESIDPISGKTIRGDLRKGIYLAGATGSGKTMAFELFSYVIRANDLKFGSYGEAVPLSWDNTRSDTIVSSFLRNGDIGEYAGKKVLCIQDLGSEPKEVVYMGNRIDIIRQLLEMRGDKHAELTMITSNLPMLHNLTKERYGERATSRLVGMCNYLVLGGDDRRR